MTVKRTYNFIMFCLLFCFFLLNSGLATAAWNGPNTVASDTWYKWPSVSNDGMRVVFLSPYPSQTDYDKQIQLAEFNGTSWGAPILLASNGQDDSNKGFAWLPEFTQPVISGNGKVVAYLGSTATGDQYNPYKSEIYIIDKTETGWGTPYPLPTSHSRHDYRVDLSYDGNTVVYTYASANIFVDTPLLFVSRRISGTWGAPVQISDGSGGAYGPSISADGTKLAWMQNNSLVYSEYNGVAWTTPRWLVKWKTTSTETETGEEDVQHVKISPDGSTITYLLLTVKNSIMVAQDVYVVKRTATGWSDPVKISPAPVIPTSTYDSAPAVNFDGTKVVYQFNIRTGEGENSVITGSYLLLTEFKDGNWTVPTPLTNPNKTYPEYDTSPVMTPDGKMVVYNGGSEILSMMSTNGSSGVSYVLTVTKSGTGSGAVSAPGLTCENNTCTGTYDAGSYVILTAAPDQGSVFTGWSQACSGKSTTCVLTMDAAKNATAVFNLPGPQPNTISYTGSVKDIDGNAVANATVEKAGDPLIYTTTDPSGNFVLYGLPKATPFHLRITKEGFLPVYSNNYNTSEDIVGKRSFRLFTFLRVHENWGVQQGKSCINGAVANNANGEIGLSGAVLTATGTGGKTYPVIYENATTNLFGGTATSSNGHYYVLDVDYGDTVTVSVELLGYAFAQNQRVFVIHADGVSEGSFFGTSTGSTYSISGSIRNISNSQGIPGVLVTVKDALGSVATTATTDASGNYNAIVALTGEYALTVSKVGFADASPPDQPSVTTVSDVSPNITVNIWMMPVTASISFKKGWNFVSFPKQPPDGSNTPTIVLADVSSMVRVMWGYDNQTKAWKKYKPQGPTTGQDVLTVIESGKGYWIYMDGAGSINLTDWSDPMKHVVLYNGWNLIGYNGDAGTIEDALASLGSKWVVIWNWIDGQWYAKQVSTSSELPVPAIMAPIQGKAYWIKITDVDKTTGLEWTQ